MLKQAVDCTDIRVKELIATAPNNSPNTDGMNFYGGHDQSIVDSVRHHSPLPGQHQHNILPKAEVCLCRELSRSSPTGTTASRSSQQVTQQPRDACFTLSSVRVATL